MRRPLAGVREMALDTSQPQPAETSPTGASGRQYVRDLPMPPELAQRIEVKYGKQSRLWRWWNKRLLEWVADELKLQYYYAGKVVALMLMERGPVVIAVGDDLNNPPIANLRERLPPEVSERTSLAGFSPWNGDTSEIL